MTITATEPGAVYTVESDSGCVYTIRHWSPAYEEAVHVWKCDCPAGRYGRECKHVRAFLASRLIDKRQRAEFLKKGK